MISEYASSPTENPLSTALEQLRAASDKGVVVALTSTNSGEGVTYSVDALLGSLQKDGSKRLLRVGAADLRNANCAPASLFRCYKPIGENLFDFKSAPAPSAPNARHSWTDNWKYRKDCIDHLRSSFDYVLVDCPAIKTASDVLSFASLFEGVILVVEADKTRIEDILQAKNGIELAGGKLVGHILNKRRPELPAWIRKIFRCIPSKPSELS